MMGIEPTIFRFEVGRLIHWATRPYQLVGINLYMYLYSSERKSCQGSNSVKGVNNIIPVFAIFIYSNYVTAYIHRKCLLQIHYDI